MAKLNSIDLWGYVSSISIFQTAAGEPYVVGYVSVGRGKRKVEDGKKHMPVRSILVMTKQMDLISEMQTWKENDIVYVHGALTTKAINKKSHCPECNRVCVSPGTIVYVNPIFALKIDHGKDADACNEYLVKVREVSNTARIVGYVCTEPKKVMPKEGLTVTQYQIAIGRKYFIREDNPAIKEDFPWVRAYGETALQDKDHIKVGSEVLIDGYIQSREVKRSNGYCPDCGIKYAWRDHAMEIVPFATEYLNNFNTEEEIAEKKKEEDRKLSLQLRDLFGNHRPIDVLTEEEMVEKAFV